MVNKNSKVGNTNINSDNKIETTLYRKLKKHSENFILKRNGIACLDLYDEIGFDEYLIEKIRGFEDILKKGLLFDLHIMHSSQAKRVTDKDLKLANFLHGLQRKSEIELVLALEKRIPLTSTVDRKFKKWVEKLTSKDEDKKWDLIATYYQLKELHHLLSFRKLVRKNNETNELEKLNSTFQTEPTINEMESNEMGDNITNAENGNDKAINLSTEINQETGVDIDNPSSLIISSPPVKGDQVVDKPTRNDRTLDLLCMPNPSKILVNRVETVPPLGDHAIMIAMKKRETGVNICNSSSQNAENGNDKKIQFSSDGKKLEAGAAYHNSSSLNTNSKEQSMENQNSIHLDKFNCGQSPEPNFIRCQPQSSTTDAQSSVDQQNYNPVFNAFPLQTVRSQNDKEFDKIYGDWGGNFLLNWFNKGINQLLTCQCDTDNVLQKGVIIEINGSQLISCIEGKNFFKVCFLGKEQQHSLDKCNLNDSMYFYLIMQTQKLPESSSNAESLVSGTKQPGNTRLRVTGIYLNKSESNGYNTVLKGATVTWSSDHHLLPPKVRSITTSEDGNDFLRRLRSFILGENKNLNTWPDSALVRPEVLVFAGFAYKGNGFEVQCDSCGLVSDTRDWDRDDDDYAIFVHRNTREECSFVNNYIRPHPQVSLPRETDSCRSTVNQNDYNSFDYSCNFVRISQIWYLGSII